MNKPKIPMLLLIFILTVIFTTGSATAQTKPERYETSTFSKIKYDNNDPDGSIKKLEAWWEDYEEKYIAHLEKNKKALANTSASSKSFAEANKLYLISDIDGAIKAYEKILADSPYHLGARNNYGLALMQVNRHWQAIEMYKLLCVLFEYVPDGEEYVNGFDLNIYVAYYQAGLKEMALDGFYEHFDWDNSPEYIEDYAIYNYYWTLEDSKKAVTELTKLQKSNPNDADLKALIEYFKKLEG